MATSTNRMKRQLELDAARQTHEEAIRVSIEEVNKLAIEVGKAEDETQWPKFVEMFKELNNLRRLQDPHQKFQVATAAKPGREPKPAVEYDYKAALIDLVKWLKKNGAKIDGAVPIPEESRKGTNKPPSYKPVLSIAPASSVEGNGVFVTRDCPAGEHLIKVPRKLFMTTEDIKNHHILKFILRDELIASIESIQLAIMLVYERYKDKSFWEPYIRALPRTYSTVYYWTLEEIESLKGTPLFKDAITAVCTAVKAYYEALMIILVHEIMRKSLFTYDTFIWALSAVYSRQNTVPSMEALQKTSESEIKETDKIGVLALIPGYDMFNYAPGDPTSTYLVEDNSLSLTSMSPLKEGEQAYMWYGPRPNSDLLLHQGFVPLQNPSDYVIFEASLAPKDPLRAKKTEVLTELGFKFEKNGFAVLPLFPNIVAPSTALFMRVLVCNDESALDVQKLSVCLNQNKPVQDATEQNALKMFHLKCLQLLNALPEGVEAKAEKYAQATYVPADQHVKRALALYFAAEAKIIRATAEKIQSMIKQ